MGKTSFHAMRLPTLRDPGPPASPPHRRPHVHSSRWRPETTPGAWVWGPSGPSGPATTARSVTGSAGGRGKGGAAQPRLPRGYLTAQQPRTRTPQCSLRTCRARGRARGPRQTPKAAPRASSTGSKRAGVGRKNTWCQKRRPHVAVTPGAPPPRTPSPSHPAATPALLPPSAARPQAPTVAPSHPTYPGPTPPTCFNCRHPRER